MLLVLSSDFSTALSFTALLTRLYFEYFRHFNIFPLPSISVFYSNLVCFYFSLPIPVCLQVCLSWPPITSLFLILFVFIVK